MQASLGEGRLLSSTYRWKINNYKSYHDSYENGKYIPSPDFDVYDQSWHLELYPNGRNTSFQDNISLFLILNRKLPSDDTKIRMELALSLIEDRQNIIIRNSNFVTFSNTISYSWGRHDFVNKSLIVDNSSMEVPDKISIVCEIIIKEEESYKTSFLIHPDRIDHFENLKNQLNNPKFSDVTFKVEDKSIHAHKMILAANSDVFAAMFEHDMQENKGNIVTIKDISYKVFYELLNFLYCGECRVTEEDLLSELFQSADKYQLLKLKDTCEQKLLKQLSVDSVMALLQLADKHCAERLKEKAIDFIALHGNEIIDQPSFQAIGHLDNKLHQDIFRAIFKRIPPIE